MLAAFVFVCMEVCGVVTQILAHWMLYGRKKLKLVRIAARSKKYILIKNECGAPPCGSTCHYGLDLNSVPLIRCHVTPILLCL